MSEPTSETTSNYLEKMPQWFVPAAGIIYATGFLIVFSFQERFSVRETGDFFKVKYIHVGIMYWLFPAIVVVPLYCFYLISRFRAEKRDAEIVRLNQERKIAVDAIDSSETTKLAEIRTFYDQKIKQEKQKTEPFKIYRASVLLVINMLLVFYVFAMFAPIGFATQRGYLVFVIFATTLVGVILIRVAVPEPVGPFARWILCLGVIVGLDLYSFKGLFGYLWEILWGGGKYFLMFLFLIALAFERTRVRTRELEDWRQKLAVRALALCVVVALFYLSILAFALRIYPYIPVLKGGGDYLGTPEVVLCFQGANTMLNVPDVAVKTDAQPCLTSKPLQIIEETTSSIFVADPAEAGGPINWRTGTKPTVYEIRRDRIASITYINREDSQRIAQ
jgi:hypothetical protein